MRRADRERDAAFAMEVLRDCEYATLATINSDGTPYCVPLSIAVAENTIYFHCAHEGKKFDNIKNNENVCINGVRYTKLVPENFTTEYESATATGKCRIISDKDEKIAALKAICEKYANSNMINFDNQIEKFMNHTCICKIIIENITGKANTSNK